MKKKNHLFIDGAQVFQFPRADSDCVGETESTSECKRRILILKAWITKRLLSIWLNVALLAFRLPLCDQAELALCPLPGCSCGREEHKEQLNLWCLWFWSLQSQAITLSNILLVCCCFCCFFYNIQSKVLQSYILSNISLIKFVHIGLLSRLKIWFVS